MTDHYPKQVIDQLADARAEIERLRAHILDIDAHATPYGDLPDEPGYTGTYLLTAGALHRALGTIGHSAASCPAEAERDQFAAGVPLVCSDERHGAKVRGLEALLVAGQKATTHWEETYAREVKAHGATERALSAAEVRIAAALALHQPFDRNGLRLCAHCSNIGQYGGTNWPCATALALGVAPPPPPCPTCRGYGQVPDFTRWDACHGEPEPKPCPACTIDSTTTPGAAE